MKGPLIVVTAALAVMLGVWTTYTTCPGCVDRTRANSSCEWTGDTAFIFDPLDVAHRQHLVSDAHLAEELAVRYADGEFGRRFGVEHHGGLIDGGRFRRECLERMLHAVVQHHQVSPAQVERARAQRDLRFDLAVSLLFVPFYVLGAIAVCRRVFRRFPPEEPAARWVGLIALSLAVSLLGVQLLRLWGGVWETIRVGNGHIGTGIRSAAPAKWAHEVFDEQLIAGLMLFWLIALAVAAIEHVSLRSQATARSPG